MTHNTTRTQFEHNRKKQQKRKKLFDTFFLAPQIILFCLFLPLSPSFLPFPRFFDLKLCLFQFEMASERELIAVEKGSANGVYGLCFEVEAKESPVILVGLLLKFRYQCSFCVQTTHTPSSELNGNFSTENEWSLIYTGEDMGKKTEHRAIFNEPIVMSPLEKRCFLIYKTHSRSNCALEVFNGANTVEDENVIFHGSRWNTVRSIGEGIPPFRRGLYTLNGGLIYDLSCGLKPAKR